MVGKDALSEFERYLGGSKMSSMQSDKPLSLEGIEEKLRELEELRKSDKQYTLNLSGQNLSQIDFTRLSTSDLSRANLSRANLYRAILDGVNLYGADLSSANMKEAHLINADLREADLSSTDLTGAKMRGAKLQKADLSSAHPVTILQKADLTDVDLSESTLSKAILKEAILTNAKLFQANLSEVDLSASDLQGADLREAILNKVQLAGAKLENVKLSRDALSEINPDEAKFNQIFLDGKKWYREETINASKAAKTYLSDIQQVAEALSSRINSYYDNVLKQSRLSFNIAFFFAIVGTMFFLGTISFFVFFPLGRIENTSIVAIIGGIGGTLVEVISGVIFYLYGRTSNQLKAFHVSLNRTHLFLLANSICENLGEKEKSVTRAELVEIMANTSAGLYYEEQRTTLNENSKISAKNNREQRV
jgi:uncharacterized protein YjbI with pentapeptide repeats